MQLSMSPHIKLFFVFSTSRLRNTSGKLMELRALVPIFDGTLMDQLVCLSRTLAVRFLSSIRLSLFLLTGAFALRNIVSTNMSARLPLEC
jgi:hypothetical protein